MRPVFYTKCREELILKVIVTLSVDVLVFGLTITKEIDKYLLRYIPSPISIIT